MERLDIPPGVQSPAELLRVSSAVEVPLLLPSQLLLRVDRAAQPSGTPAGGSSEPMSNLPHPELENLLTLGYPDPLTAQGRQTPFPEGQRGGVGGCRWKHTRPPKEQRQGKHSRTRTSGAVPGKEGSALLVRPQEARPGTSQ